MIPPLLGRHLGQVRGRQLLRASPRTARRRRRRRRRVRTVRWVKLQHDPVCANTPVLPITTGFIID